MSLYTGCSFILYEADRFAAAAPRVKGKCMNTERHMIPLFVWVYFQMSNSCIQNQVDEKTAVCDEYVHGQKNTAHLEQDFQPM